MRKLLVALFGCAVLGAVLASAYVRPTERLRAVHPTYVLGPGDVIPEFIDDADAARNLTVNVTVVDGGPINVYLSISEWIELALNSSEREIRPANLIQFPAYTKLNVTDRYDFSFEARPEVRYVIVLEAAAPRPVPTDGGERPDPYDGSAAVRLDIAYPTTVQRGSVAHAGLLAAPSVLLVGYAVVSALRRARRPRTGA